MRRGGEAAAGGYSEKILTGIPLYCRLYWNDVKRRKKNDDEDEICRMPRILVVFTGCRWPSWMLRLLRRRLKIFVCDRPRLNICDQ